MNFVKKLVLLVLPGPVGKWFHSKYLSWRNRRFKSYSTKEMFTEVYSKNLWGTQNQPVIGYYSGPGSHDVIVVSEYVACIEKFMRKNPNLRSAVDLGCGDFNIGKSIAPFFDEYIGVDIVEEVVEHHRKTVSIENVTFKTLNAIEEELPYSDVVFVREVLQHLKNDEIIRVINNIKRNTKCLVVTESLPGLQHEFTHNLERGIGPNTRVSRGSGVVLSSDPFAMNFAATECLNITYCNENLLKTDAYFF
jgi:SAM-dependent methyltransferase